jgi:hypothetical protein
MDDSERERIGNSLELVPFLERCMHTSTVTVYGSFVRKVIEVCVVDKRELLPKEIHEWLKTHDIDIAMKINEETKKLIDYLGSAKNDYYYKGCVYTEEEQKDCGETSNWESSKYLPGNHSYYMKGIKYDVTIYSEHYELHRNVDFTCNSFSMFYLKTEDGFKLYGNWRYSESKVSNIAKRHIVLAKTKYTNNVKVWHRMTKLIENGYQVDMGNREQLIDFVLSTLYSMFEDLTMSFKSKVRYNLFIIIDGERVYIERAFVSEKIQNIILDVFSSEITVKELLMKMLTYMKLFNFLDQEFYAYIVSKIIKASDFNNTISTIQNIKDIYGYLKKYEALIDKLYSKTKKRTIILDSIKRLCFVFGYLCNLLDYVSKKLSRDVFIQNVYNGKVCNVRYIYYLDHLNIVNFVVYCKVYHTTCFAQKQDNSIISLDNLQKICDSEKDEEEITEFINSLNEITLYNPSVTWAWS